MFSRQVSPYTFGSPTLTLKALVLLLTISNKEVRPAYLLVQLNPCKVAFAVYVLETEEPHLPQTDCLHNLIEELLTRRRLLDRELQLRVHRSHPDIHLRNKIHIINITYEYVRRNVSS